MPMNNREWWRNKLEQNAARDRAKDRELELLGWEVHHFWEHEAVEQVVEIVEAAWRRRTGRKSRNADFHP